MKPLLTIALFLALRGLAIAQVAPTPVPTTGPPYAGIIYANQIVPTSSAQATFGGSYPFSFPSGIANLGWTFPSFPTSGDMTSAINAAIIVAGAQAGGGQVQLPCGNLIIAGTIVNVYNNTSVNGCASGTTLVTSSATADIYQECTATGSCYNQSLSNVNFNSSVTRTAGAAIHTFAGANGTRHTAISMSNQFNGFQDEGIATTSNFGGYWTNFYNGGDAILVDGGQDSKNSNVVMVGGTPGGGGQVGKACIEMTKANGADSYDNMDCLGFQYGQLLDPTAGNTVNVAVFNNVYGDSAETNAVYIYPTGVNANVYDVRFTHSWAGSATGDGVYVNAGSGAYVSNINFVAYDAVGNQHNGIHLSDTGGGTVQQIHITAGSDLRDSASGYCGLQVDSGVQNWTVTDSNLGNNLSTSPSSQSYGVCVNAGANHYVVANNTMENNATGAFLDANPVANNGTDGVYINNIGTQDNIESVNAYSMGLLQNALGFRICSRGTSPPSTPCKTIRTDPGSGDFQIINNGYGTVLLDISDSGTVTAVNAKSAGTTMGANSSGGTQTYLPPVYGNSGTSSASAVHFSTGFCQFSSSTTCAVTLTSPATFSAVPYVCSFGDAANSATTFKAELESTNSFTILASASNSDNVAFSCGPTS